MAGFQSKTVSVPDHFVEDIQLEISLFSEAVTLGGSFSQWVTKSNFPHDALPYLESLLGIRCI